MAEPDKRQWQDEETGLPCLIVRGPVGALCGYAGVSKDHPAHGLSYSHWGYGDDGKPLPLSAIQEAINGIEVHSGLTFADSCGHGDNPAEDICHIPGPGQPDDIWWFGFDCSHYNDWAPGLESRAGRGKRYGQTEERYRPLAYVEAQVRLLARQLASIAEGQS